MKKNGTGYLSASDFIAAITVQSVDLEVPDLGTVQVRGLTLVEVQSLADDINNNPQTAAARAIGIGMVNPRLTDAQIEQLQSGTRSGALNAVTLISNRIFELSGLAAGEVLEKKVGNGS